MAPVKASPALRVPELFREAEQGSQLALGRLVSLVEQGGSPAAEVSSICASRASSAYVIGMTGAPGAGKSTLVSRLIAEARAQSERVAVLAIDPTSPLTGGAMLGDRVRMQDHVLDSGVFVRSMATRGHLGGLALAVPQVVRLLDAMGFGKVIVETVGVGQVEVEVASHTDTVVVVVTPGWGDAVQAHKAGLLEVADIFVVNKADRPGADATRRDLEAMLDLGSPIDWRPPVLMSVGITGEGVPEIWKSILDHRDFLDGERLAERRSIRLEEELRRLVREMLDARAQEIMASPAGASLLSQVAAGTVDPWGAARRLLDGRESDAADTGQS